MRAGRTATLAVASALAVGIGLAGGDTRELPEGEGDGIGMPGRTDFGRTGWGGPCPPSGEHRYVFTLYALSEPLGLGGSPTADQVRGAMSGRVLGEAQLTGVYTRSR